MQKDLEQLEETHIVLQRRIAKRGGDVRRVRHPRHRELYQLFCRENSCTIYYNAKYIGGIFLRRHTPIYQPKWLQDPQQEFVERVKGKGQEVAINEQHWKQETLNQKVLLYQRQQKDQNRKTLLDWKQKKQQLGYQLQEKDNNSSMLLL